MPSMFWILPVILVLVPSGSSLSCGMCGTTWNTSCTGPIMPCAAGSACLVTYTMFDAGNYPWALYTLTCGAQKMCGLSGTGSLPENGKIKMATSCCTTDNCVPPLPTLPEPSSMWNGMICPSCVNPDSIHCAASKTMQCRGNETMCFSSFSQIPGIVATSTRGCAAQSICDVFSRSKVEEGTAGIMFACTSGNLSLKSSL
ncbi:phospholipase A2 inhibitor NAI-like isoform 1-T2 [Mantella aurantiaca]